MRVGCVTVNKAGRNPLPDVAYILAVIEAWFLKKSVKFMGYGIFIKCIEKNKAVKLVVGIFPEKLTSE